MNDSDLLFGLLISFKKREYSFENIEWLTTPFKISESSLRTNLSRMTGKGILRIRKEGRRAFYSFTEKAKRISSNVALSFNSPDWSNWNNEWWGISVSFGKNERSLRYYMETKLQKYRFAALHSGFWIRPYNSAERIGNRITDIIRNENSSTIRFKFYTQQELDKIPGLWNVHEINRSYKYCLSYISNSYDEYNLKDPKEALIGKMILGNIVVQQLFKDPLLPERFLPKDWQGNKLRIALKKWDKITTEKSKTYWEEIFSAEESASIISQPNYGNTHQMVK